jgi:hypothetical protein
MLTIDICLGLGGVGTKSRSHFSPDYFASNHLAAQMNACLLPDRNLFVQPDVANGS